MPVTIKVNGEANSLVHKGSNHFANSTVPDVCKTPSPGGPVPIPYPVIVSLSSDLANGSTTVKADGGNMIGIKGCEFSRCTGDEAGTAGGVKSSTFGKEAKFISYSFDVKIDGQNACRLTDQMTMNHENTVCLTGAGGPPVSLIDDALFEDLCEDMCEHENAAQNGEIDRDSDALEYDCRHSGKYEDRAEFRTSFANDPAVSWMTDTTKPDVITVDREKCYDFKLCGDSFRGDQVERLTDCAGGSAPIEVSCETCGCCECPEG
jgi:hypothetical protein